MGEMHFNLFLFVVSIAGLINVLSWQVVKNASEGPATHPRITLTVLLVCSLICIIQILKQKKEEQPDFVFMDLFKGHGGLFLPVLVVYVASLGILGFMVAIIIYLNVVVNVMICFSKGSFKIDKWLSIRGTRLVAAAYGMAWFFQSALKVVVSTGIFGIQK